MFNNLELIDTQISTKNNLEFNIILIQMFVRKFINNIKISHKHNYVSCDVSKIIYKF